jgi:hypothetical protein
MDFMVCQGEGTRPVPFAPEPAQAKRKEGKEEKYVQKPNSEEKSERYLVPGTKPESKNNRPNLGKATTLRQRRLFGALVMNKCLS